MKKSMIIFTATILLTTIILGILSMSVIHSAYNNEIKTVQNIAGAVLSKYPQAKQDLVTAVTDNVQRNVDMGKSILSHYGYDENMDINNPYKNLMTIYLLILAIFIIIAIGCGYTFFFSTIKKRKNQENKILSILDCCLSGNYSFISDEHQLNELNNPYFADTLVKLAESMHLKTEYLNEEHDNTKTLVTDISHQLKTPISALKACFSMYLEAGSEEERSEFLTRSKIQMDKLESLTSSLINISRLENDMITLQTENAQLTDILVGAVNTVYHKALKKNTDIITSEFEDIKLLLDKKWTVEAIANILDNAIKYSPCGSEIKIRVQKLYSFVRIEIEDEGIGVLKDERNKIFSRFYRGKSDVIKNEEGSGVGLYLARKILEAQGGTISVNLAPKKGSIFIIQLLL